MLNNPIIIKDKTFHYCVAHTPPLFELPEYYNLLQTADFEIPNFKGNIYSIREYVNGNEFYKPKNNYYGHYSANFLNELLKKNINKEIDFVVSTSHRKIVTRDHIGKPSKNFKGMNIAPTMSAPSESLSFDKASNFLICKPLEFKDGVFGQYARKHSLIDFLEFSKILVLSKILSDVEVKIFFDQRILFPALPLGILPSNFFLELIDNLSKFILYSDKYGYKIQFPEDPYQVRARDFFMERLSSYLFVRFIKSFNNLHESDFGNTVTFSDSFDSNFDLIYVGGKI